MVAGERTCLYRDVDQSGQVTGVLLVALRDLAAARRFLTRALRSGTVPASRAAACPGVPAGWLPRPCMSRSGMQVIRLRMTAGG